MMDSQDDATCFSTVAMCACEVIVRDTSLQAGEASYSCERSEIHNVLLLLLLVLCRAAFTPHNRAMFLYVIHKIEIL